MESRSRDERFTVRRFKNPSGKVVWRVAGYLPDGRRVRENFALKADALDRRTELEQESDEMLVDRQLQRTKLTGEQIADAETAFTYARTDTLTESISRLNQLEDRLAAHGSKLEDAIKFYESHYRPEITEISLLNAQELFLKTRISRSDKTLTWYRYALTQLLQTAPNKAIHTFTVSDIEALENKFDNINSRRTLRQALSAFFSWAERHHYTLENPCKRLESLPLDTSQILILTLDEVKRLLKATIAYRDGCMASGVAILLFAGLRPSELRDLSAQDVNHERIRVTGGKLRRKMKRAAPIPATLRIWLDEYPWQGLPAGWEYRMRILKEATQSPRWVADILRHTSISYQAQRDQNEGLTVFNNGTSKAMMDRHYRDVIDSPADLEEFWNLTPAIIRSAKITVELPSQADTFDWPSNEEMEKLVWKKSRSQLAREWGISDNAIRKHCLKRGIDLPPQGYWARK